MTKKVSSRSEMLAGIKIEEFDSTRIRNSVLFYHNDKALSMYSELPFKKVNRKVQGMPQSQNAANPRHQEEKERTKTYARTRKTNKHIYDKYKDSSLFPKRGDQNAKTNGETRTQSTRRL